MEDINKENQKLRRSKGSRIKKFIPFIKTDFCNEGQDSEISKLNICLC